jgi:hypothetical protein
MIHHLPSTLHQPQLTPPLNLYTRHIANVKWVGMIRTLADHPKNNEKQKKQKNSPPIHNPPDKSRQASFI